MPYFVHAARNNVWQATFCLSIFKLYQLLGFMNLKFSEARNEFFFADSQPRDLHFREGTIVIHFLKPTALYSGI